MEMQTWNPTTGCDRISTGCDRCYALTLAARLKVDGDHAYQRDGDPRTSGPGFGLTMHEEALDLPLHWQEPRLVLVNTMSDLFHEDVPTEFIARVFAVMEATPRHRYQVLTKRSKRLARLAQQLPWPANVAMGVSIENDQYSFRADDLRTVPAAARFLQLEPLLTALPSLTLEGIRWVVVGGENGPGARPMADEWVTDLRERCEASGVRFRLGLPRRHPIKHPTANVT